MAQLGTVAALSLPLETRQQLVRLEAMSITTGAATGGNGGDISLLVGDGDTGTGGAMTLTAGKATAATTAQWQSQLVQLVVVDVTDCRRGR